MEQSRVRELAQLEFNKIKANVFNEIFAWHVWKMAFDAAYHVLRPEIEEELTGGKSLTSDEAEALWAAELKEQEEILLWGKPLNQLPLTEFEKSLMNPAYKEVYGDLIELSRAGEFDVIVHQANCFHAMGKGIAKAIKEAYPEAYKADLETPYGDYNKVGTYSAWYPPAVTSLTDPNRHVPIVVNAYAQFGYGAGKRRTDYEALRIILRKLNSAFPGARMGMPKIGCGLAGGDWTVVQKIIREELANVDVTIVFLPS